MKQSMENKKSEYVTPMLWGHGTRGGMRLIDSVLRHSRGIWDE